jgi:tetratricopeptide (TPR) repeat protein
VLSGALVFAALDQYLRSLAAQPRSRWVHAAIATLLYIAALLTKPTAMILPAALVIIHLLLLRKYWKTLAITLAVWVPLAVADLVIALRYQPASNVPSLPIRQRLLVACDAIAAYLRKIVLPIGIVPDYGRWPQRIIAQPGLWWAIAILFIVLAILAIRRAPSFSAGAAMFLLALGPLLGLVKFEYQFYSTVADRYVYLAMFGVALIVAAILDRWRHRALMAGAAACVVAISILSVLQVLRWRDTRTLFDYTLSVRPDSFIAHKVLGLELSSSDPDAAIHHFQAALAQRPDDPTTHYNFGELLARRGDIPAATSEFEDTVRLKPTHAKALDNLGIAMWRMKRLDEAQSYFERSIDASSQNHDEFADPHAHLALLLEANGDTEGAIQHLQEALRINPNLPGARRQLDSFMRGR